MSVTLANNIYNTNMAEQWVVVYKDDGTLLLVQKNNKYQVTTAKHIIETFETEKNCLDRVDALNVSIDVEPKETP